MKRQRGYSLAEIGMAIGIGTVLAAIGAGAGLKVSNDSRAQSLAARARDVAAAVDTWMAREGTTMRGPKDTVQGCCGGGEIPQLAKFMPDNSILNVNPWTSFSTSAWSYFTTANDTYANANAFSNTGYPMDGLALRVDSRGLILILTKGDPSYDNLRVWDNSGTSYKSYRFYAVQAIDNRGYPAITVGK